MQLLDRLKDQYSKELPFVVFRKPDITLCKALLQNNKSLETTKDFQESGFVMAPFNEGLPTLIIRPDEVLEDNFHPMGDPVPFGHSTDAAGQETREEYITKVQKALEVIESEQLQKVVLSRKITVKLKPDPFYTFETLLRQFPEAFCYFLYHPKIGIWMGASPETLLIYSKDRISTVSLAGTQKVGVSKDTLWTLKEIREQEYVTRFIEKAIEGFTDPPIISNPETVQAGNLLHLKTLVEASNPRVGLEEFIEALHPTPAVCGIPADKAQAYLVANEGYARDFYTGFLGELNWGPNKESHLFVNLRCMNFKDDEVHVYVGGGLVKGSDPEQEWQETVHKSASMLHLLRNSTVGLG